jgi:hypothetical protein
VVAVEHLLRLDDVVADLALLLPGMESIQSR